MDTLIDYQNYKRKWDEWYDTNYENLKLFPNFIDGIKTTSKLTEITRLIKLAPAIIRISPYNSDYLSRLNNLYILLDSTKYNLNTISTIEAQIENRSDSSKYLNIKYDDIDHILTIEKTDFDIDWFHILLAFGCYLKSLTAHKG